MERKAFSVKARVIEALASRWCSAGKIAEWRSRDPTLSSSENPPEVVVLARLEQVRLLLRSAFAVPLEPVRRAWDLGAVKDFCGGVLEPRVGNEWKATLRQCHAPARVRASVGSTLFLFRKVVPPATEPDVAAYVKKLSTPSAPLDPSFLAHVRKGARELFPEGWDKTYRAHVEAFTLPSSSAIGCPRMYGGVRGRMRSGKACVQRPVVRAFQLGQSTDTICRDVRVMSVPDGPKWRIVTVGHPTRLWLRPVHHALYDALTDGRFPQFLRGDATAPVFRGFRSCGEDEVIVSGDYASATDNLPLEGSETILREAFANARFIPHHVRAEALRSWRSTLKYPLPGDTYKFSGSVEQESGQLMGSLMSFPILCAFNHLVFTYLVRRPVPVVYNGDDIVFRARREEADHWMERVGDYGFTLSRGKTLVRRRLFSLNSRFFYAQGSECPSIVKTIRSKPWFMVDDRKSFEGCLDSCADGRGRFRGLVQAAFLLRHRRVLDSTRRSIRRGLGVGVREDALRESGCYRREAWYLALPAEPGLPGTDPWSELPEGWTRSSRSPRHEKEFRRLLVECAWAPLRRVSPVPDLASPYVPQRFAGSLFERLGFARPRDVLPSFPRKGPRFFAPPQGVEEDLFALWDGALVAPVVGELTDEVIDLHLLEAARRGLSLWSIAEAVSARLSVDSSGYHRCAPPPGLGRVYGGDPDEWGVNGVPLF